MIRLKNVSKTYGEGEGKVCALQGVDLTIAEGGFACIWGASGSGKSTLLNLLGLLDRPDSGNILFSGSDVALLSDNQLADFRRENIGFIFQAFNLIPVLTVLENVMIPLQVSGINNSVAKEKSKEILTELGLGDKFDKLPDQISGGQKQRVAIARALVGEPKLVLADEPTANLDSVTGESIIALMKELNMARKITFVFSTHDKKLLNFSSHNIYLSDGKIDEYTESLPRRVSAA
jgi:putative ABC transport system ATP-binding protein